MKLIVVDASVVINYLLENQKSSKKIAKFFSKVKEEQSKLISLILLELEVANGLRFSVNNVEKAQQALASFKKLPIKLIGLKQHQLYKALEHSDRNQTTVYDTAYHLLAISRKATFVTCDKQYFKKAKHLGYIRLLG